jgi:hypothetical protein
MTTYILDDNLPDHPDYEPDDESDDDSVDYDPYEDDDDDDDFNEEPYDATPSPYDDTIHSTLVTLGDLAPDPTIDHTPIKLNRIAVISVDPSNSTFSHYFYLIPDVELPPDLISNPPPNLQTFSDPQDAYRFIKSQSPSPSGTTTLFTPHHQPRTQGKKVPPQLGTTPRYPQYVNYGLPNADPLSGIVYNARSKDKLFSLIVRTEPVITTKDPEVLRTLLSDYKNLPTLLPKNDLKDLPPDILICKQREPHTQFIRLTANKAAKTRRSNDNSRLLNKVAELHLCPYDHIHYSYLLLRYAILLRFSSNTPHLTPNTPIYCPSRHGTLSYTEIPDPPTEPSKFSSNKLYLQNLQQNSYALTQRITSLLRTLNERSLHFYAGIPDSPLPIIEDLSYASLYPDPYENFQRDGSYDNGKRSFYNHYRQIVFPKPLIYYLVRHPPSLSPLRLALSPLIPWIKYAHHNTNFYCHSFPLNLRTHILPFLRSIGESKLPPYAPPQTPITEEKTDHIPSLLT